jgi:hypothetical protein
MRATPLVLSTLAAALVWTRGAHAEQVILTDVSYTHSTETTEDSHYRVDPPEQPSNWVEPIDYSAGSVHIIVDVKTKPDGDAPTKFQICFEGTPSAACTDQSPTYTKPGKIEWTSQFANFWYGGEVDWSQGVRQIALLVKDDENGKPVGDPLYMPTDVRVEVALLSPGETYQPPAEPAGTAGAGGAAGATAGTGGTAGDEGLAGAGGSAGAAGAANAAGSDAAGASGSSAGGAGGGSAPTAGSGGAAGSAGTASSAQPSAAGRSAVAGAAGGVAAGSGSVSTSHDALAEAPPRESSSCRVLELGSSASGSPSLWLFALLGVVVAIRRRAPRALGSRAARP